MSVTFDLNGFLPFSTKTNFNGGSTPHGEDGCIIIPSFTSRTFRTFVGCNKTSSAYLPYQFCMVDVVEKSLDIKVYDMIHMLYLYQSHALRDSCFSGTVRTKSV